ncbi:Rhodanese-like protein [Sulfitobacter noctilucae]|uniref:rhodanese-like domain-containing protein n=1 Tax=Sulfitobacter noctilucae TaxID=1342302 RepID=UPI00055C1877|nr:rhodanese-like domain-containing protein [Sulfitobacter noctilucae]KIN70920.1 Rhodanese-like protein [Sulfitobacter noctilucae]
MTGSSDTSQEPAPPHLVRRALLLGGVAALGACTLAASRWFNVDADVGQGDLTAPQAQAAAAAGAIVLVDIRRPDEWARTGIPATAVPIDMRSADFLDHLLVATGGKRDVPIALICARGVRSAALASRLSDAGFTQVLDVPEGVLGSGAGPGWLKRGLPLR